MNNPFSLKNFSIILPLITAGLYLVGWSYYSGYIGEFGLTNSMFPVSTNENIISGTMAILILGLKTIPWIAVIVWASIAIIFIYLSVYFLSNFFEKITGCIRKQIETIPKPTKVIPIKTLDFVEAIYTKVFVYSFSIYLVALLLVHADNSGKAQAALEKNSFSHGNSKLAYLDLGDQVYQAMPIQCSQSHCAYWLGEKAVILKQSDVKQHFAYPKKR